MKTISLSLCLALCALQNVYSQNWQLGGNNAFPPPNAVTAANNIFGTNVNLPIRFHTANARRMTLFDNTFSTAAFGPNNSTPNGGGLAIHFNPANPITAPKSLLHIGEDLDPYTLNGSGWRTWMRVGTYNNFGSDNFYIGLKNEGPC